MTPAIRWFIRLLRAVRLHKNIALVARQKLIRPSGRSSVTYRIRGGPSLSVDAGVHDLWVVNEVWLDRVYAVREDFLPRPGWVVYDIGAHKGIFSMWAASMMGTGEIYAFEPQPHNFSFLTTNTSQFPTIDFHLTESAVGTSNGQIELYFDPTDSGLATTYPSRGAHSATISVHCMSFEDAMRQAGKKVDLVKIDVEGTEHDIFSGSPPEAFDPIDRVVVEYHSREPGDQHPADELARNLEALGFLTETFPDRSLLGAWRPGR